MKNNKTKDVNDVIDILVGFNINQKNLIKDIVKKESDKEYNKGFIDGQNNIITDEANNKRIREIILKDFTEKIKEEIVRYEILNDTRASKQDIFRIIDKILNEDKN